MTTPTVQDLISKYNGTILTITGPDQGQCTAVPHAWQVMLGLGIVYGNAKDTYANAPDDIYDKVLNIPDDLNNYPNPGAIVVWNEKWGSGFGHTGVVVSADGNTMQVLEQNDGDNGLTHVGQHNYQDVIGWFTPKILTQVPVNEPNNSQEESMNAQQEADAYRIVLNREPDITVPDGRTGIDFIYDARNEVSQQRQNTASTLSSLQSQVDSLSHQNTDLTAQATADQNKVASLSTQIKSQSDIIAELNAKLNVTPIPVESSPVPTLPISSTDTFLSSPSGKLLLQFIGLVIGYATPYVTGINFPPDISALIGTIIGHFTSNKVSK